VGELSNDRAGLHKGLGILLATLLLSGCATKGMNEWDYKLTQEGYTLHCTEMYGEQCITYQWLKEPSNKYEQFQKQPNLEE
jgi:hypothetical protein